jgi:lipopolysaccharide/colanic/teichoic acid biosynthesis glycosyltransferase
MKLSYPLAKRLIDICLSLILCIAASPLFVVVFVLLLIDHKGNPFFVQKRPGLHSKLFSIIKFKTMKDLRDDQGELLPDGQRLTSIGRIIRTASMDELPQLFNVLKGDMSLVGPRPLLPEYLSLYDEEEHRRHEVKPGITGWAQVNGRNSVGWKTKFQLDIWYIDHAGFLLDCRIMLLTLKKIILSEGIGSKTSATMEKFSKSL